MSEADALSAIEKGKTIVQQIFNNGTNCIGFGEMGIGNTSSASLIMSSLIGLPIEGCVGRGTGSSDEQLKTKIETLKNVFEKHQLNLLTKQPLKLLSAIGGFEIAMMTGAFIKAAELKMITVVDGFIATAALLLAKEICCIDKVIPPFVQWGLIFAHTSGEQGHKKMMAHLHAKPLLQLSMRLGEGTGAALAIPLIQSAINFLNKMASFESAGVSGK